MTNKFKATQLFINPIIFTFIFLTAGATVNLAQPGVKLSAAAKTDFEKGNYNSCISEYTGYISSEPKNDVFYAERSRCYLLKGIPLLTKSSELTTQADAEFVTALADVEKALALNPKNTAALNVRGLVKSYKKDEAGAIADFSRSIEIDPKFFKAYMNRALRRDQLKDYEGAIADYTKFIELNPQISSGYANRGNSYFKFGKDTEAIADYTKAIELDPQNASNYFYRGNALNFLKKYPEAIADLNKAIELNPKYTYAYVRRGESKAALNKKTEAIADLTKAIELDPNNKQAADALARFDSTAVRNDSASASNNVPRRTPPSAEELSRQARSRTPELRQKVQDVKEAKKDLYGTLNTQSKDQNNSTGCVSGNCINGFGKYVFSTGDIYEGNWVNNKMDGQGTLTYKDGDIYTGQYTAGKKSGKGKYIFANGNIYEGNWVNGKREGQGTLTFKIGEVYIGEWKNDKRDGYGKQFIKSTGKVLVGNWKNDEFIGSTATAAANNKETREKAEKAIQTAKTNNSSAKKSDDDEESELDRIAREEGITISDEQKRQNEKDAKMMADAFTKNPKSLATVNDALSNVKTTSSADYKMTELLFRKQDITKKLNEFQTAYSKPATDRQRLNLLNGIIGEYRTALTEIENAEKANLNFSTAQTKIVADYKTYYTKASGILDGMLGRLKTESGQTAQAAPELDKMNADNKVILASITAIQNEFRASTDPKRRRELLESAKAAFQKALANTQNTQRQNPNLSDSDKQVIARVIEGLTQRIKQLDASLSQLPQ